MSVVLYFQVVERGREAAVCGRGGAAPCPAQERPSGLQVSTPAPEAAEEP